MVSTPLLRNLARDASDHRLCNRRSRWVSGAPFFLPIEGGRATTTTGGHGSVREAVHVPRVVLAVAVAETPPSVAAVSCDIMRSLAGRGQKRPTKCYRSNAFVRSVGVQRPSENSMTLFKSET